MYEEETLGKHDDEWPRWYAEHMTRTLEEDGRGLAARDKATTDMKLEVVVIPVADVDRSKAFYESLGFRLDIDYAAGEDLRVAQFTPPGSEASVIIGTGITSAQPGSLQGMHLVVFDIEAAHAALVERGVNVSDVFHDAGGVFHHAGNEGRATGPDPDRRDYGSFASFNDPDGNGWLMRHPAGT